MVEYGGETSNLAESRGFVVIGAGRLLRGTVSHPGRSAERGPRIGILGGGQLARMTAEAAVGLGVEVFVIEREAGSPAGQIVGPDHEIVGDWRDLPQLAQLAERVDVVTLENEFIDPDSL